MIARGELSPVKLTDAYLDRAGATRDTTNAFAEVFFDDARREAEALELMQSAGRFLGPLHGIPVVLKDNIALEGRLATCGSKVYAENVSERDAAVAARLKSAGAVVIGKTNMDEFALGASTDSPLFGPSRNPWDPSRFCCGSSGGSGASVADGTSLAALGTDTGGSVRLPSSVCGIVGMRPTIGRVPIEGIVPASYSMDTCGPMTRNVRDNAIMLNVMAGYQKSDPSSSKEPVCDYTAEIDRGVKNMRIGIFPDYLFRRDQPDVIKAVKNAFEIFKDLGAEVVEQTIIGNPDIMKKSWFAVCGAEAAAVHQKNIRERPGDYGAGARASLEAGQLITGTAYVQAQRYRRWLREQFVAAFSDVDFFLFPTTPFTAVPVGQYDLEINGETENTLGRICDYALFAPATGLPALSVPCGLDGDGLPIGLQLLGSPFGEQKLYRAAAAFEEVWNLHSQLPAVL